MPSAMIAVFLPPPVAAQLAQDGGEDPAQMHVTLAYFGKPEEDVRPLAAEAARAAMRGPMSATYAEKLGEFDNLEKGGDRVIWASVDSPDLHAYRDRLLVECKKRGLEVDTKYPDFKPHITLKYLTADDELPVYDIEPVEHKITEVSVAWGDERAHVPLEFSVVSLTAASEPTAKIFGVSVPHSVVKLVKHHIDKGNHGQAWTALTSGTGYAISTASLKVGGGSTSAQMKDAVEKAHKEISGVDAAKASVAPKVGSPAGTVKFNGKDVPHSAVKEAKDLWDQGLKINAMQAIKAHGVTFHDFNPNAEYPTVSAGFKAGLDAAHKQMAGGSDKKKKHEASDASGHCHDPKTGQFMGCNELGSVSNEKWLEIKAQKKAEFNDLIDKGTAAGHITMSGGGAGKYYKATASDGTSIYLAKDKDGKWKAPGESYRDQVKLEALKSAVGPLVAKPAQPVGEPSVFAKNMLDISGVQTMEVADTYFSKGLITQDEHTEIKAAFEAKYGQGTLGQSTATLPQPTDISEIIQKSMGHGVIIHKPPAKLGGYAILKHTPTGTSFYATPTTAGWKMSPSQLKDGKFEKVIKATGMADPSISIGQDGSVTYGQKPVSQTVQQPAEKTVSLFGHEVTQDHLQQIYDAGYGGAFVKMKGLGYPITTDELVKSAQAAGEGDAMNHFHNVVDDAVAWGVSAKKTVPITAPKTPAIDVVGATNLTAFDDHEYEKSLTKLYDGLALGTLETVDGGSGYTQIVHKGTKPHGDYYHSDANSDPNVVGVYHQGTHSMASIAPAVVFDYAPGASKASKAVLFHLANGATLEEATLGEFFLYAPKVPTIVVKPKGDGSLEPTTVADAKNLVESAAEHKLKPQLDGQISDPEMINALLKTSKMDPSGDAVHHGILGPLPIIVQSDNTFGTTKAHEQKIVDFLNGPTGGVAPQFQTAAPDIKDAIKKLKPIEVNGKDVAYHTHDVADALVESGHLESHPHTSGLPGAKMYVHNDESFVVGQLTGEDGTKTSHATQKAVTHIGEALKKAGIKGSTYVISDKVVFETKHLGIDEAVAAQTSHNPPTAKKSAFDALSDIVAKPVYAGSTSKVLKHDEVLENLAKHGHITVKKSAKQTHAHFPSGVKVSFKIGPSGNLVPTSYDQATKLNKELKSLGVGGFSAGMQGLQTWGNGLTSLTPSVSAPPVVKQANTSSIKPSASSATGSSKFFPNAVTKSPWTGHVPHVDTVISPERELPATLPHVKTPIVGSPGLFRVQVQGVAGFGVFRQHKSGKLVEHSISSQWKIKNDEILAHGQKATASTAPAKIEGEPDDTTSKALMHEKPLTGDPFHDAIVNGLATGKATLTNGKIKYKPVGAATAYEVNISGGPTQYTYGGQTESYKQAVIDTLGVKPTFHQLTAAAVQSGTASVYHETKAQIQLMMPDGKTVTISKSPDGRALDFATPADKKAYDTGLAYTSSKVSAAGKTLHTPHLEPGYKKPFTDDQAKKIVETVIAGGTGDGHVNSFISSWKGSKGNVWTKEGKFKDSTMVAKVAQILEHAPEVTTQLHRGVQLDAVTVGKMIAAAGTGYMTTPGTGFSSSKAVPFGFGGGGTGPTGAQSVVLSTSPGSKTKALDIHKVAGSYSHEKEFIAGGTFQIVAYHGIIQVGNHGPRHHFEIRQVDHTVSPFLQDETVISSGSIIQVLRWGSLAGVMID